MTRSAGAMIVCLLAAATGTALGYDGPVEKKTFSMPPRRP